MTKNVPLKNGGAATVHRGGAACCPACGADEARWAPYFAARARGDMDEAKRLEAEILAAKKGRSA